MLRQHPIFRAMGTNLAFGLLLFCVGPLVQGQTVQLILVHQTTADVRYAGTDDDFVLSVEWSGGNCARNFPDLPSDERERRRSDDYSINVASCSIDLAKISGNNVYIQTRGHNAWLPSSFRVTARMADGSQRVLLDRSWPSSNCFSTDSNDWSPKVCRAKWSLMAAPASSGSSGSTGVSTVDATLRLRIYKVSVTDRCNLTFDFWGNIGSAASGATPGQITFTKTATVSNMIPTLIGGSSPPQYACDVSQSVTGLTAGSWTLGYRVPYGSAGQCAVSLPMSLNIVSFSNGKTGCSTGLNAFP